MIWHWLLTITGSNNVSGIWYGFWSGFAGDLPEFAIFALIWKRLNCHAKGCYRVGLHHVYNTHFTTCRKHHPQHDGSSPATAEQIAETSRQNTAL